MIWLEIQKWGDDAMKVVLPLGLKILLKFYLTIPPVNPEQIPQVVAIIQVVVNPQKVILFGSYAKGHFVEHRFTGRYASIY